MVERAPKGSGSQRRGYPEPVILNLMKAVDSAQKRDEHINFHRSFRGSWVL